MASYSPENRYLYLEAPVSPMLIVGFSGHESISQLFHFQLDVLVENSVTVNFDALLGKNVSFGLQGSDGQLPARDLHGLVVELAQGSRDRDFTDYKMTVAPQIWMLTCMVRSRIFQHLPIPDVLRKVFEGFDVSFELQGQFEKREYVVQYQESDFAFASRLMEEEGIFYFFRFSHGEHKMVIANSSQSHNDIPGDSSVIYEELEGGVRDEERVTSWTKQQNWGSGKYTLWDHHIQLPGKNLDAEHTVLDSVQIGKATHKLKLNGNDKLEVYENPGVYAKRFDGIDKTGGEQAGELSKVFQDKDRTVKIRTQQGEAAMLSIYGESNQRQFTAGHKFSLQRHFDGNAKYVLTAVSHSATEADVRSEIGGSGDTGHYSNTFNCIPYADPYRFSPPRITRRPTIHGPQSALVVGPPGEEIFTDKYGRIKVQFHWDREGTSDINSSCWLNVATSWAGHQWGIIYIPRVGQEVIVSFFEGDPDRPLVTGSVYNPEMMPPWTLPANKTQSGIKTHSTPGGGAQNYNLIRFEDKKGSEQLWIHAENAMLESVEGNQVITVGGNRWITTGSEKDGQTHGGETRELVYADRNLHVKKNQYVYVEGHSDTHIKEDENRMIEGNLNVSTKDTNVMASNIILEATQKITLMAGASYIQMDASGITIVGAMIKLNPMAAVPPTGVGMIGVSAPTDPGE